MEKVLLGESIGQTAVNWLIYELQDQFDEQINDMNNSNQLLFESIIQKARQIEQQGLKEMYLKGIENYDPTFKSN
jgi:serine/threonine protein phosphatase PrpC